MRPINHKPNSQHPKGLGSKTNLRIQNVLTQAVDLHQRGLLQDALALYEKVLVSEPKNFEALHLSGLIAYQTKNAVKGVELMGAALKINPRSVACMVNLGLAQHALGDLGGAARNYLAALGVQKNLAQAHYNLGNVFKDQANWDAARLSYERAIILKPDYWEAILNLANVFESSSQIERSLLHVNRVLCINPLHSRSYNNRGNIYKKLERWNEAINDYDLSIQLDNSYPDVYVNRGNLLKDLGYWDYANASYNQCLTIHPNHPKAVWNKSLLSLLLGDFKEGWQGYEARWSQENAVALRLIKMPEVIAAKEWRGKENLKDKKIFVYAEQGIGDTIQFIRFVPQLIQLGAKVYLMVQPPLIGLIGQIKGVISVFGFDDQVPEHDLTCPLMSLPLALECNKEADFGKNPYLTADPGKVRIWANRLTHLANPKVGIVWRGSASHANDKYRSLSFEQFRQCIPSFTRCVNLQIELTTFEREQISNDGRIEEVSDYLIDYSDTAALCDVLDLVICVDTSVAHLAASLGKEVWILLPFSPDWRWLLQRPDSPWYQKVILYRQNRWGDWASALQQIKEDWSKRLNIKT